MLIADERAGASEQGCTGSSALDAGLLKDEFQVIAWDRIRRPTEAWNEGQTLRSAMRKSVVRVYQRFASELGPKREVTYFQATDYGNALVTGEAPFWVEADLAVSCTDQIAFLRQLCRNELPFGIEHQRGRGLSAGEPRMLYCSFTPALRSAIVFGGSSVTSQLEAAHR